MMAERRAENRNMFWRVIRRMVFANRGRLFVILLALGAGSAVTAALLNLEADARRRISGDFRSFGANVVLSPRYASEHAGDPSMRASVLDDIPGSSDGEEVTKVGFLYVTVLVRVRNKPPHFDGSKGSSAAILAGIDGHNVQRVLRSRFVETSDRIAEDISSCRIGQQVAKELDAHARDVLELRSAATESNRPEAARLKKVKTCYVSSVESFGGSEDSQIFTNWFNALELVGPPMRFSVVQLNVPGTPAAIQSYVAGLERKIPDVEVRPLRQFTEGEARLYGKISGVLKATVVVVLVLTGLCVMAAMTNIAAERKNDVGLMKAIGGSVRRVLRIFLAEAALLGLVAGLLGAAAGILLSIGLGKAVFGVAAEPRLVVYPVSVALTVMVAVLAAYPLRRLANIRPASVFRGEE
jgi:putative ABC transport system permease protein